MNGIDNESDMEKILSFLIFILIVIVLHRIGMFLFYPYQEPIYIAVKSSGYYLRGEKISLDKRHSEVRVLVRCYNEKKLFEQWFMKAFNLQSYFDIDPIQFREQLRQEIGREVNTKSDIIALLTNFKKLVVETDKSR